MKDDTARYERLLKRYQAGDLSRRSFLSLLGSAGLAAGVVGGPLGFISRKALAEEAVSSVRYDGWGGVVSKAFEKYAFTPFTDKTGIKVISGTFSGADEFLTQVKAASPGSYDIFHASGVFDYARYTNLGLGSKLDESRIPNLKLVMSALEAPLRKVSGGSLSAVPYDYGSTGIGYNTDKISEDEIKEKGAKILIDAKYKGKIGAWSDWRTRMWYGALTSDQDPNDIKDTEAAWDAVRKNRDLLLKYWSSGAELMNLLGNEEIWLTEAWSGRVAALQKQGHPIGFYNPPQVFSWQECLFVIKGSPMKACEELLNFMLKPEVQIAVAQGQSYAPALDPTKYDLPQDIQDLPTFDPTGTLKGFTFADPAYWNGHEQEWSQKFEHIKSGF